MNFLYRLIDSFWCYFRHTVVHFWDSEHISGPEYSILNFLYRLIHSFWWHISHWVLHVWSKWHISVQRVLDLEHSLHSNCLSLMWTQPFVSPFLNYWTYFWPKSPRSWSFYTESLTPSVLRSARQYSIFDLLNIFLAQEYSILIFLCRLVDSFGS